ncbi:MAG TPA: hypothetical protein VGE26_01725, partial [Sphingobacteriaceae bacterium]
ALLFFLADTYWFGINVKTYVLGFLALCGVASYLAFIVKCFCHRSRSTIDVAILHFMASVVILILAVLVLPFIIFHELKADPMAIKYTTIYGSLIIMGWISTLILGKTFKILPYVLWAKHYQRNLASVVVPRPADLFKEGLLKMQFAAFLIFFGCFFAGLLFDSGFFLNFGLFSFLITSLVYFTNVMITVWHKPKNTGK